MCCFPAVAEKRSVAQQLVASPLQVARQSPSPTQNFPRTGFAQTAERMRSNNAELYPTTTTTTAAVFFVTWGVVAKALAAVGAVETRSALVDAEAADKHLATEVRPISIGAR